MKLTSRYSKDETVIKELDTLCHKMSELLIAICSAFFQHNNNLAAEIGKELGQVRKRLQHLSVKIDANTEGEKQKKLFEQLAGHFSDVFNEVENISEAVAEKINDRVLFNEKAVEEIRDLLFGLQAIVTDLHDLLATESTTLANQIIHQGKHYYQLAQHYNTEHEERLIKGICMPKSSVIYIKVTSAVEEIIGHSNKIASQYMCSTKEKQLD